MIRSTNGEHVKAKLMNIAEKEENYFKTIEDDNECTYFLLHNDSNNKYVIEIDYFFQNAVVGRLRSMRGIKISLARDRNRSFLCVTEELIQHCTVLDNRINTININSKELYIAYVGTVYEIIINTQQSAYISMLDQYNNGPIIAATYMSRPIDFFKGRLLFGGTTYFEFRGMMRDEFNDIELSGYIDDIEVVTMVPDISLTTSDEPNFSNPLDYQLFFGCKIVNSIMRTHDKKQFLRDGLKEFRRLYPQFVPLFFYADDIRDEMNYMIIYQCKYEYLQQKLTEIANNDRMMVYHKETDEKLPNNLMARIRTMFDGTEMP